MPPSPPHQQPHSLHLTPAFPLTTSVSSIAADKSSTTTSSSFIFAADTGSTAVCLVSGTSFKNLSDSRPATHISNSNHRCLTEAGMKQLKSSNNIHNNNNNNGLQSAYDHGIYQVVGFHVDQFKYKRACSVSPAGSPAKQESKSSGRCVKGMVSRKNGGSCSSGGSGSSTDASTDEDSELEYGPGIVAKLKSKFLRYSMKTDPRTGGRTTGQGSSLHGRTNRLKRCSSLENIVEPGSSCCVERHRIDILDHKDLLRVSRAAPTAATHNEQEMSANVTKIESPALVTKEASVLSNGVRLLNQRNLSGNVKTSTLMTTATSGKTTAPVIRNYCLKSSPPLPSPAIAPAADHRDNNLPAATPTHRKNASVSLMTGGVTAPAVLTNRDNPFLKQYVNSCVTAASGIKSGTTIAGHVRQGRSEPVTVVKESDPGSSDGIVTQHQQQVPRVTGRRFQSNCAAKSNKHPLPPQHYHVYGSVVKRAKSMESLLFDVESGILPDEEIDDDHEEDGGLRNDSGDQAESRDREQEENDKMIEEVQHESASHDHETNRHHCDQVQDHGNEQGVRDQVQTCVAEATAGATRRPLPPVPQASPRHPPPSVPPPPPPSAAQSSAESSTRSSSPSLPSSSSSFSAGSDCNAGVRGNGSRIAIVPPIVHETQSEEQTDCRRSGEKDEVAAGRSPSSTHHWLPLRQQTTGDHNLGHNFVTPNPDPGLLPESHASSSPSTCSADAAAAAITRPEPPVATSSPLLPDCLHEKGPAGSVTRDHSTPVTPPKAPARNSLLNKKKQAHEAPKPPSSGSQDVGAEGGEQAGVKVHVSEDKSSGSTLAVGGDLPLSATTLLPAPLQEQQRLQQQQAQERRTIGESVAVKRSLVRGSSLPPVKPMIAQKPKSLKANPLDQLKAAAASSPAACTPAPLLSPFLFTPSVIPAAVGKQAAGKPQVIERQSFVKDKASGTSSSITSGVVTTTAACSPPAAVQERMLTPSTATTTVAETTAVTDSSAVLSATSATASPASLVVPSLPPIASSPSSLSSSSVTEKLPKSSSSSSSVPSTSACSTPVADPTPEARTDSCTQSLNPFTNSSSDILKVLLDLHEQKPSMVISNGGNNKSNTNCMIFDFRGKNVKPQLAITSPFGRAAVIQATGESDADTDKDCPDSPDLSPTLIFLGENEIIGNGSLLKIRNKKLRIHFNEASLTSTYEYPSESSLCHQIDDLSQANASDVFAHLPSSEIQHHRPPAKDPDVESAETLIKPANPDEASSWSASSAASDLLF